MTEPSWSWPPPDPAGPPPRRGGSVAHGALLVLAGHALAVVSIAGLGGDVVGGFLFIVWSAGLFQWIYVVPLLVWAYATRRRRTVKGVWIMAGLTVLPTLAGFAAIAAMIMTESP